MKLCVARESRARMGESGIGAELENKLAPKQGVMTSSTAVHVQ